MKKCPSIAEETQDNGGLRRDRPSNPRDPRRPPALGTTHSAIPRDATARTTKKRESPEKVVTLLVIGFAALPLFIIAGKWLTIGEPAGASEKVNACKFNGSSAIAFPHDRRQMLARQFTIECWYRVDGPGSSDWIGLISKSAPERGPTRGYALRLYWQPGRKCPNKVVFRLHGANVEVSRDFNSEIGAWNHLAVAADSYNSTLKIFLNGKYLSHLNGNVVARAGVPKVPAKVPKQPEVPVIIGGEGERFRVLNGAMSDVRISNVDRLHTVFVPQQTARLDKRTVFLARLVEGKGSRTEEEVSGVRVPFTGLWDTNGPTYARADRP